MPSAICDSTGVSMWPGQGWWHQPNSDRDLCTASLRALPPAEQALFVEIKGASDLGAEACDYTTGSLYDRAARRRLSWRKWHAHRRARLTRPERYGAVFSTVATARMRRPARRRESAAAAQVN